MLRLYLAISIQLDVIFLLLNHFFITTKLFKIMDNSSCIPKTPFVKLEEDGQASILNYNLPQETTYNAISYVGLNVPLSFFKPDQVGQTTSPYWNAIDEVKELNVESIKEAIKTNNTLVQGNAVLTKNIAQQSTALAAVSNQTLTARVVAASKLTAATAAVATPINTAYTVKADGVVDARVANAVATYAPVIPTAQVNIKAAVKDEYVSDTLTAQKIAKGCMPVVVENFSRKPEVLYIDRPKQATPTISIILHLKMASYLGDYGAGQTVKTFSLLPGEKTTITVRTYQHDETKKAQAQNILDSYSESSADDLQNTVQKETRFTSGETEETITSKTGNWNAGGSIGLNLGFLSIGGGGGGGGTNTEGSTLNSSLQTQVGNLVNSVSHHVSKSDSLRQIEVNTESSYTRITETEETIVRELENINKSRVLNFVFRQLLQEYFSITYLHDVSFVYYNGFPESQRTVKLAQLPAMLEEILVSDVEVNKVKNEIYTYLCNVFDYEGTATSFIEKIEESLGNCIDPDFPPINNYYVRKRKDLSQSYRNKSVNGIILDVTHRIMRTPSLVTDALLGQGEALDCYNQKLQDAAVISAALNNEAAEISNQYSEQQLTITNEQWETEKDRLTKAITLIESITDPIERAKLYKKVFTDCCDVPQSGGCGCNDNTEA